MPWSLMVCLAGRAIRYRLSDALTQQYDLKLAAATTASFFVLGNCFTSYSNRAAVDLSPTWNMTLNTRGPLPRSAFAPPTNSPLCWRIRLSGLLEMPVYSWPVLFSMIYKYQGAGLEPSMPMHETSLDSFGCVLCLWGLAALIGILIDKIYYVEKSGLNMILPDIAHANVLIISTCKVTSIS